MSDDRANKAVSFAALSISEALALALADQGVLSKESLCAAIADAVAAHRDAAARSDDAETHLGAAMIAERIKSSIDAEDEFGHG